MAVTSASASSSSSPAIAFDGVWKRYHVGGEHKRGVARRRKLVRELSSLLKPQGIRRKRADHIWALADVSFTVGQGESVGIIGANGGGKSTTLKLISRITQPWAGAVRTRGRIGSLIELRSGIHPELTGRENIYLYGTILGMRRADIRRKFDDIVDFAELGRFIDTPVKHYSSGMEVRLGFSVAVHLEPDVLLIDEVLAVGDESFQRRCLRRMDEISAAGQTVVFVSHVFADVKRLCPRVIYIHRGSIRADGPADDVIDLYLADVEQMDMAYGRGALSNAGRLADEEEQDGDRA
jgi:lipopolysaccharide transport system ATP-binding protein